MMKKFCAFLALLVFVSTTFGQSAVEQRYIQDAQISTYRSGLTSDDAADLAAAGTQALTTITLSGKVNVRVSARFSVASATCKVIILRYSSPSGTFTVDGITTATVTADAYFTVGGLYIAQDIVFDTAGSPFCKILVKTISSGNVTLVQSRM